ncbi:MAG: sirohydrochlorin chelatase [Paracoccaceae bacterium]
MTHAVIIAHGQPSDPGPAAAALATLGAAVAQHLPGWTITTATLAEPGALAAATQAPQGRAFPLFMAGGWFTRTHLPAKLREAGATGWQVLEPFGCDPALHALAATVVTEALQSRAWSPAETKLLLAAHGSFKSPVPSDIAHHLAARIAASTGVTGCAAFIDQSPQLAQATGYGRQSLCLPFFAAEGGHVTQDIPAALTEAGFRGDLLPPLGLDPRVPQLIAAAIAKGATVCTTECRWRAA